MSNDLDILRVVDANQHDGQIPGDSVGPQCGTLERAPDEHIRGRPQRRVGVQHGIGQHLEQMRFVVTDTQVVKLDLRPRPGQRPAALKHSRVAVLVCQIQDLLAGRRDDG